MFHTFAFCCLCCWHLVGVFADTDTVKSVKEGDSVALQINVTEIQTDDEIEWTFGTDKNLLANIIGETSKIQVYDGPDGRFRNRLKLDQTGSLTITNTRTTDSGLYEVKISRSSSEDTHRFSLTVYDCRSVCLTVADGLVGSLRILTALDLHLLVWMSCREGRDVLDMCSATLCRAFEGVRVLVDAREKLHIPWGDPENQVHGETMMAFDTRSSIMAKGMVETKVFLNYLPSIRALWQDSGIQNAYDRRREFQLGESVKYFLDNVDKLGQLDYLPSQKDILLARKPTKGIHEYDFEIESVPFKMVDVGGQRSERKRWFEWFETVTSILFLVSSSEYDQVLMEDRQTNRLTESLSIFETIVNNRVFASVSIILFLNKTDLLEEKVKNVNIKDYFPEFTGDPHNLPDVQKFLVDCFRNKRRQSQEEPLYHHFTTAINTENIRLVFSDVKDTILHHNIKGFFCPNY